MRLLGHRLTLPAVIGIGIVVLNISAVLLGPFITPFGERDIVAGIYDDPSFAHWLGTDNLGRDMLSRLIFGGRTSIGLSIVITLLAFFLGVTGGFTAAISGGWMDMALSRLVDLLLSMPILIFAFIVLSVMGTAIPVLIVTIAVLQSTIVFRLARSVATGIVTLEYVEAAKLRGEGVWWLISREVLPNALPPLVAEFGLRFCFVLLLISALSFLGIGVQAPNADWGSMVSDFRDMIYLGYIAPLYPAGAIAILSIGVNFIVDWLLAIHSRGHGDGA